MWSLSRADSPLEATGGLRPYLQIARVDHWFKNSFMLFGVLLAAFYRPDLVTRSVWPRLLLALVATCLVASSNYVLNELHDRVTDAAHPQKRTRPVPSGRIKASWAYAEWLGLGGAGILAAALVSRPLAACAVWLWVMGIVYNVPPLRAKEWPHLDVMSEAVNNPIRLLLGWFAVIELTIPPLSLLLSYWMIGAFFMAVKRYGELRHLGDARVASAYRRSFGYYTEANLLVSILFYATASALFAGIFIVRYHLELILFTPLAAGLFAQYLKLGLLPDSPAQHPERLYRHHGFVAYLVICFVTFLALMFVEIPALYDWFNVAPPGARILWRLE